MADELSICPKCGHPIRPGDEVSSDRADVPTHKVCPTETEGQGSSFGESASEPSATAYRPQGSDTTDRDMEDE